MQLLDAKCTSCGANLKVNTTEKTAFCSYCGSSFLVEQAVQNYYVNNVISAENVYVQNKGEDKKEHLLKNAKTNEKFKDYAKASQIYAQITEEYPNEYRGWLGLANIITDNFNNVNISYGEFEELTSYMNKALICAPDDQKSSISSQWEKYKNERNSFVSRQESKLLELETKKKSLNENIKMLEDKKSAFNKSSRKYGKSARGRVDDIKFGLLAWSIPIIIVGFIINLIFDFWGILVIGIILFIVFIGTCIFQLFSKYKKKTYIDQSENVGRELAEWYQNRSKVQEEIDQIKNKYNI